MPTKNVVLTEHQAEFVERLVSSGLYQNASEVLREGLRLVEQQEAQREARLDALREAAHAGIADMEAGRYETFNSRADLKRYLNALCEDVLSRKRRKKSGG
jgi:antitoxin ParD1/3/4